MPIELPTQKVYLGAKKKYYWCGDKKNRFLHLFFCNRKLASPFTGRNNVSLPFIFWHVWSRNKSSCYVMFQYQLLRSAADVVRIGGDAIRSSGHCCCHISRNLQVCWLRAAMTTIIRRTSRWNLCGQLFRTFFLHSELSVSHYRQVFVFGHGF